MEASERDRTDDWIVEPARAPATVLELEGRIDVALAIARTAEEAALEIGAASLEAAEQARRAAALAESASAAAMRAAGEVAAAPAPAPPVPEPEEPRTEEAPLAPVAEVPEVEEPAAAAIEEPAIVLPTPPARRDFTPGTRRPDPFDERLTAFRERAESVMIRLQKLEAGTPPGDGPSEVVRLR